MMFNWNLWFQYSDFNAYSHRDTDSNKGVFACMCTHVCISWLCQSEESTSKDTPVVAGTLGIKILVSKYHYPIKRTQEGKLIERPEAKKIKMSLEYLVPKGKKFS